MTMISAAVPIRTSVGLFRHACVQAASLLRAWSRDPGIVVQALFFPLFMLLMFQFVLGKTITSMGAGNSIYGTTGLVALVAALYGTLMTALGLIRERDSGQLSRMWTLPVPRAGFVAGRILAEGARTLVSTVLLFAVAVPLGFRFDHGWPAGIGAVAVPVLFGVGMAVPVLALATMSAGRQAVEQLGALYLFLLFFNSGFAPASEYPGWLQPVVRYQPMTPAIDTIRGLTEGGPVAVPLSITAGWVVVLIAVFGPMAVAGYRRAAQDGGR